MGSILKTENLSIIILENPDYSIGKLTPNSIIDYKLTIVGITDEGKPVYTVHASSGGTTLGKLNTLLSEVPQPKTQQIQVELDVYLNTKDEKIHYATVSSANDMAKKFSEVESDYPYIFSTDGDVEIRLIADSAMEDILNWSGESIDIDDLRTRINELDSIIKSTQLKMQFLKKSSTTQAYNGLGLDKVEEEFAKKGIPEPLQKLQDSYTKMSMVTSLDGDIKVKANLIANIYKNYSAFIKLTGN